MASHNGKAVVSHATRTTLNALADQAGESRIWAGIHFRTDVLTGLALGRKVATKVIEGAKADGS